MHFFLLVFILHYSLNTFAQNSFNATGADAISSAGKVAYSIGQVFYTFAGDSSVQVQDGVQQAYSISNVSANQPDNSIELKYFPNPTSDILHLEINIAQSFDLSYEIIDKKGVICYTDKINQKTTSVNLRGYAPGIYFLRVISIAKERESTFKILKH